MTFGDTLYGCRFDRTEPLTIKDDVWLVGHCLVAPITAHERSLAMLGSLVVSDMEADRTYAGTPARDVTSKFGSQFEVRPVEERRRLLEDRLDAVVTDADIRRLVRVVDDKAFEEIGRSSDLLVINVESRTYAPADHPEAVRVLRSLLPRAKFVPASDHLIQ